MASSSVTPPPLNSTMTTSNGDKLSGQLIIKAQLGDDIRKMMIHNEDLTLNELILMMQRIFAGKISNSDDITIKYLDDDGDKITLLTDSDLTVALHFHKILRLFVFVNGQEQIDEKTSDESEKQGNLIDTKTFRTELQQIRNSVQNILDRLQVSNAQQDSEPTTSATISSSHVVSSSTKEFDPLKNAAHVQHNQARSTTPDSVRSKSSVTNMYAGTEQRTYQPAATGQTQSLETNENTVAPPTTYTPTQIPTQQQQQHHQQQQQQQQQQHHHQQQHQQQQLQQQQQQLQQQQYVPPSFVSTPTMDQQAKLNAFGAPPSSFTGMQPPRLPSGFPPSNASTPSGFNPTGGIAPPPLLTSSAGQTATFIGQQAPPPSQPPLGQQQQQQQQPPPQQPPQSGFYAQQQQQQNFYNPRPPNVGFNQMNSNNTYAPQNQPPVQQPPTSSSPATINPSFVAPPPMAAQQPYGGYQPQAPYFNPAQNYPKTS